MKTCPICNNSFDCFPEGNCWCEAVKVDRELDRDPSNCLCPQCLSKPVQERKKETPYLAPRLGQRPALPFDRGVARNVSYLDRFKKKPS